MSVTVTGLGAAIKGLEALARTDRARLFKQIGAEQSRLTYERLKKRQSHTDGTYPASRRAKFDGGDTLWDTGAMMKSFGPQSSDADSVTMGFSSALEGKKAAWNQYGTRAFTVARGKAFPITAGGSRKVLAWARKKAVTPPRPLFGVSPRDARTLTGKINDFWIKAIKSAGLKNG